MASSLHINSLLDLSKTIAADLFKDMKYPWQVLPLIHEFTLALGPSLPQDEYNMLQEGIWVAKNAKIADYAQINGPVIICENAEIRNSAFIRGDAIIGPGAVVGNSTELKNSILFEFAAAPHYNYIGDSILGYRAHMGAGAVTSNVKADKTQVVVHASTEIPTGLKKFGAILGDYVEIGCNSVLNPGSVIGRGSSVYPLSCVRGIVAPDHIYKSPSSVVERR